MRWPTPSSAAFFLDRGDLDGAIAEFRRALELKPDDARVHYFLGKAFSKRGDLDGAMAEFRRALELESDYASAHQALGNALRGRGDLDNAIVEYRRALELKPDYASAHNNLGTVLRRRGDLDNAIAEYRRALELKPDEALLHNNLGLALSEHHDLAGAIVEFRRALELDPDYAAARGNLRQCEHMVELEQNLPLVLSGERDIRDSAERIEYADLCYNKHLFAAAARFFEQALAENEELAEDPAAFHRYNAACCAALAGCGQGVDAASLDEAARERWRRQALDWLCADLQRYATLLSASESAARTRILNHLQHWQRDPDLAGVRDPGSSGLAKLPQAEQESWRTLWADVQAVIDKMP